MISQSTGMHMGAYTSRRLILTKVGMELVSLELFLAYLFLCLNREQRQFARPLKLRHLLTLGLFFLLKVIKW